VTLALTARGQTMLQAAHAATRTCLAGRLVTLSASDRAAVTQAMQVLHPLFVTDREIEIETSR
jgi:hypothetical protein